jgi:hypothetical protein
MQVQTSRTFFSIEGENIEQPHTSRDLRLYILVIYTPASRPGTLAFCCAHCSLLNITLLTEVGVENSVCLLQTHL